MYIKVNELVKGLNLSLQQTSKRVTIYYDVLIGVHFGNSRNEILT